MTTDVDPKQQILLRFIDFLKRFRPLDMARVGTMGGDGREATLWEDRGVAPKHRWMIEHSRVKGSNLIRRYGPNIHYQNQLGSLRTSMAAAELNPTLDGFHLDICGVVTPDVAADLSPTLALILESIGRVLGISTADQRFNPVYGQWKDYMARANALCGTSCRQVFETLVAEQKRIPIPPPARPNFKPFDSVKGAKREFGLLVELLELLRKSHMRGAVFERFVYVSRLGRTERPFRMRSYFIHFEPSPNIFSPCEFVRLWLESPLYFVTTAGMQEVKKPSVTAINEQQLKAQILMPESIEDRLKMMATAAGPEFLACLQSLTDKARRFEQLNTLFTDISGGTITSASVPSVPSLLADHGTAVGLNRVPRKPREQSPEERWENMSEKAQLEFIIKAAELRHRDPTNWEANRDALLAADLGDTEGSLRKSIKGWLAHMKGDSFRTQFVRKVERVFGQQADPYLARLSALPIDN